MRLISNLLKRKFVKQSRRHFGFTIVELVVVITIIGILGSVVFVSYNSWRQSVTVSQLKSDLIGVSTAMNNEQTFSNTYPLGLVLPSSFNASDGVTLSGGSIDGKTFCINAVSSSFPTMFYYIDSTENIRDPQEGKCTTYTVSFDSNGGSAISPITDVWKGTSVSAPADPTRASAVFDGWYKEAGFTNIWNFGTDKVTSNITLYAKWVVHYDVAFDSNGGSAVATITGVDENSLITTPANPTKTAQVDQNIVDLSFLGWYKEAGLTNQWNFSSDRVNSNITLYASWAYDYTGCLNVVQIDAQTWCTRNINVGTMKTPIGTGQINNGATQIIEKWCYSSTLSSCTGNEYGGLYTWNEAMQYSTVDRSQGICPSGFHVASHSDWSTLEAAVGGSAVAAARLTSGGLYGSFNLKAGAGYYWSAPSNRGNQTYIWTSTQTTSTKAYTRAAYQGGNELTTYEDLKGGLTRGYSVRCMKD